MTTRINFINHNGTGYAEPKYVADYTTVAGFFRDAFPGESASAFTVTVNGQPTTGEYVLREGDTLAIVRVNGGVAQVPTNVSIVYMNNSSGGFAGRRDVRAGTTVHAFLRSQGVEPRNYTITVNGQPVLAEQVLRQDDRLSVTPSKIRGALEVVVVSNDGNGFAGRIPVSPGTTMGQLVASRTNCDDPSRYTILVNGSPVTQDYVLAEGDRVSITPVKIHGAEVAKEITWKFDQA